MCSRLRAVAHQFCALSSVFRALGVMSRGVGGSIPSGRANYASVAQEKEHRQAVHAAETAVGGPIPSGCSNLKPPGFSRPGGFCHF